MEVDIEKSKEEEDRDWKIKFRCFWNLLKRKMFSMKIRYFLEVCNLGFLVRGIFIFVVQNWFGLGDCGYWRVFGLGGIFIVLGFQ